MPIAIERGLPMPPAKRDNRLKYPFRALKVDESFFVAGGIATSRNLRALASLYSRRYKPVRFATRAVEGGVRVWRIT